MERPLPIPCAQSEPASIEDSVISALLWRAAELIEWEYHRGQPPSPPTPLQALLDHLFALVKQDQELARLLEELPPALGSGMLLQAVFARLFPGPPQPIATPIPLNEYPRLTPREVEILQEMALGRGKKEIAKRFSISPGTVKTHFSHLYAKLNVAGPQEAVAKAAALGLLPLDFLHLISPLRGRWALDYNAFSRPLLVDDQWRQRRGAETMQQLASLGLFLFLLSPLPFYHPPLVPCRFMPPLIPR